MYQKLLNIIANIEADTQTESKELSQALQCVLQEDILAEMDMPPFNKSAMDGYACRREDLGNELKVLEVIPAGIMPTKKIGKNECSKIMTGAALPEDADCVFKVEESKETEAGLIICMNAKTKNNICYLGEDYKRQEVLIQKGCILGPDHLAVAAGAGYQKLQVSKMPSVGLIITGSELLDPGVPMQAGKIRNSNGIQISSLLQKMGITCNYYGIVGDELELLTHNIEKAFLENDIVMVTGGASMGDFDFVPKFLVNEGFKIYWERTGLKPGNPMTFASRKGKYFFGLSGNPVSSLVQFEYLAKPVLYQLLGASYQAFRFRAVLESDFIRKNADRQAVLPVILNAAGKIEQVDFNGSAHINGLASGNAFIEMPVGVFELKKGDWAYVRQI